MKHINNLIKILNQHNCQGYLVGGFVRDYLLNRENKDIDLVINEQVKVIAKKFADEIEGSFVILDEVHNIYRVVIEEFIYDFAPIVGDSIKTDLLNRDFTINALAVSLADIKITEKEIKIKNIIDPTGGQQDLKQGLIKVVSKETFKQDPLRLFRTIRFRAELNFSVDSQTELLMKEVTTKIKDIAKERIHDELMKILAVENAAANLNYLEKRFSLLSILIPQIDELKVTGQCKYHREDIWTHSLYAVKKLEELFQKKFWKKQIKEDKLPLLKFATLFHDIGKLMTEEVIDGEVHFYGHNQEGAKYIKPILRKLRFSRQNISYITQLIRYHMRPLELYYADNLTKKGKYRFFRQVEERVADVCFLAAADTLSTKLLNNRAEEIQANIDFLKNLIKESQKMKEKTKEPLLDGHDVMDVLSITEGPQIGEILEKIKEAQAQGKINNREEAIEYLKFLHN